MRLKQVLYLAALAFGLVFGPSVALAGKPIVFVSIVPQKYFVDQIAGGLVEVKALVPPGASPHTYEPTPSQMMALAKAKAFFAIGINLEEAWLPRITSSAPSLKVVETQHGVVKIPMLAHEHHEEGEEHHEGHEHEHHATVHEEEHHEHGDHAEKHDEHHKDAGHEEGHHEHEAHAEGHMDHHDHGTLDPHIWLDPIRVRTIARNTCEGLIKADPQNRQTYEANLTSFLADLDETHETIAKLMKGVPSDHRSFMVFHPSWGYFAQRYGLEQLPIEVEGREPSPKTLAEIIGHAREEGVKVIFVQPQTSKKTAMIIAKEIAAEVKELDPLAEDWKQNIMKAAEAFKATLH